MISTDNANVFEQYYQKQYDFNTSELGLDEIMAIKRLVKEKRVDYALAPIGDKVFEFIISQEPDLAYEIVNLKNEKVDGMLYIPHKGKDKAYIIINGNKPLINQIFAAAHEYYHYIKDYEAIKSQPYICCLSSLKDINEKKASRFAAELLLPENSLENEVNRICNQLGIKSRKDMSLNDYAVLSITLTVKYQLPLKAVLYRLYEEEYIKDIKALISKYDFMKQLLLEIDILKEKVDYLYSNVNNKIDTLSGMYKYMETVYASGLATKEEILEDAKTLGLNMQVVESFFELDEIEDNDEDNLQLISSILERWEG